MRTSRISIWSKIGSGGGLLIYQTDGTAGVKAYIGGAWYTLNTTADP